MLPVLRILPVGGVFLAILLLVLALNPPDGSFVRMAPGGLPRHGAMIAREAHPEWAQFLRRAAIRRAGELNRLRELLDAPTRNVPQPGSEIADLPPVPNGDSPDAGDVTGSIAQEPTGDSIPIDIGEASSAELPVGKHEEMPPITTPERLKSRGDSTMRKVPRARRAKTKAQQDQPQDPLAALFSVFAAKDKTDAAKR